MKYFIYTLFSRKVEKFALNYSILYFKYFILYFKYFIFKKMGQMFSFFWQISMDARTSMHAIFVFRENQFFSRWRAKYQPIFHPLPCSWILKNYQKQCTTNIL